MRLTLCSFLFALVFLPLASNASEASSIKQKWSATQKKIVQITEELSQLTTSISGLEKKLQYNEKLIHDRAQTLHQLNQRIQSNQAELSRLENTYQIKSQQQATYYAALQKHILFALKTRKQNDLQLLLSNLPLSHYQRFRQYHHLITTAEFQTIDMLKQELQSLLTLQNQIQSHQALLRQEIASANQIKQKLEQDYQSHRTAILNYRKGMAEKNQTLSTYQNESKALAKLLDELRKAQPKQRQSKPSSPLSKLTHLKFRPPLPKVTWSQVLSEENGKRFSANTGTPVYAIKSGKVVFSNWLKGLGYLIIVDHGQGYMSLYGTNQTLLKSVGDTVQDGEQIAQVGNSGGFLEPGLYFELRKDGQPVNYNQSNWILE